MSSIASVRLVPQTQVRKPERITAVALWIVVGVVAAYFVRKYAGRYLVYTPAVYGPYWPFRWSLALHIAGGFTATILGPLQFWKGLRQSRPKIHRIVGWSYLMGVLIGGSAALYLITDKSRLALAIPLFGLNLAWLSSSAMALVAILRRNVQQHREWMVRSYVATYAFVVFRLLVDLPVLSDLGPQRNPTIGWLCWSIPLFCTEIVLQWRRVMAKHA